MNIILVVCFHLIMQEKRLIADRLKIDENGHENLRNTIVQELKSQVLREQKKLEEVILSNKLLIYFPNNQKSIN